MRRALVVLQSAEFLFECPRCASRVCELPSSCAVCSLQLVSAPLLARSYHHLFPVAPFTRHGVRHGGGGGDDDSEMSVGASRRCYSCHAHVTAWAACEKCGRDFCDFCDSFIHDELHNCPGCVALGRSRIAGEPPGGE